MPGPVDCHAAMNAILHKLRSSPGLHPSLTFGGWTILLLFELAPHQYMPWHHWGTLAGTLCMVVACLAFNLMLWRVYRRRGDLQPLRLVLGLLGVLFFLVTLGRVVNLVSFFTKSLLPVEGIIGMVSGLLALLAVLLALSAESYVLRLPSVGDLQSVNEQLMDTRALLALRETMAMEAMLISAEATIIEANPCAYQILEYDADQHELIGLRATQLVHDDDYPIVYQHLLHNHSQPYVVRAITKTGLIKHIQVMGTNFTRAGGDLVRVTNFRDVTIERKFAQQLEQRDPLDPTERLIQELAELRAYFNAPPVASSHAARHL